MSGLPILAIERLMKEYGAERISEDAKVELKNILENYLEDLSIKASKIAVHTGRKTITGADVKIANQ